MLFVLTSALCAKTFTLYYKSFGRFVQCVISCMCLASIDSPPRAHSETVRNISSGILGSLADF